MHVVKVSKNLITVSPVPVGLPSLLTFNKTKRKPTKPRATKSDIPKEHLNAIVNKMHTHFGTSVRVSPTQTYANGKKKKGVIEIDFFSNDELDRLLTMLDIKLD